MYKFLKIAAFCFVCLIFLFSVATSDVSGNEKSFTDVTPDMTFFPYIEAIYAEGITVGYGDGTFGPNDTLTRGEMAAFLTRALGLHHPDE